LTTLHWREKEETTEVAMEDLDSLEGWGKGQIILSSIRSKSEAKKGKGRHGEDVQMTWAFFFSPFILSFLYLLYVYTIHCLCHLPPHPRT
jgi:hypothetical protein